MPVRTTMADELKLAEDDFRVLRFLGEAAGLSLELGCSEEAEEIFRGLLHLAPNSPVGFQGVAEVLFARGDTEAAERAAVQACRAAHADAGALGQAYLLRARIELRRGRLAEGGDFLGQAMEVDPEGPIGIESARLLDELASLDGEGVLTGAGGRE